MSVKNTIFLKICCMGLFVLMLFSVTVGAQTQDHSRSQRMISEYHRSEDQEQLRTRWNSSLLSNSGYHQHRHSKYKARDASCKRHDMPSSSRTGRHSAQRDRYSEEREKPYGHRGSAEAPVELKAEIRDFTRTVQLRNFFLRQSTVTVTQEFLSDIWSARNLSTGQHVNSSSSQALQNLQVLRL